MFSFRVLVSAYVLLWLGYFRDPCREETCDVGKAAERPKMPVITFGTMGTTHSVRDYGAGPSGVNDTGAHPMLYQVRVFSPCV